MSKKDPCLLVNKPIYVIPSHQKEFYELVKECQQTESLRKYYRSSIDVIEQMLMDFAKRVAKAKKDTLESCVKKGKAE